MSIEILIQYHHEVCWNVCLSYSTCVVFPFCICTKIDNVILFSLLIPCFLFHDCLRKWMRKLMTVIVTRSINLNNQLFTILMSNQHIIYINTITFKLILNFQILVFCCRQKLFNIGFNLCFKWIWLIIHIFCLVLFCIVSDFLL